MPLGPIQTQVYVNPLLSNLSVQYTFPGGISEVLFPTLQVPARTGIYFEYDKSPLHATTDVRAPGTRAARVEYGMSQKTYGPILEHALEQPITDEDRELAMAPLDMETDTMYNLTKRVMINKEIDAFNKASNTAVLTQNATLSGTSQWSDYANSDPVQDGVTARDTVKKAIGVSAKDLTVVLGYEVFSKLMNHPQFIERYKYSQAGVLTAELLAQVWGVKQVLIAEAEYNTANENQTDSMSYIWGKNAWFLYITATPGIRIVTFGYTLRLGLRQVKQWREEAEGQDVFRVLDKYQQYIVAAPAAYYIHNAIA